MAQCFGCERTDIKCCPTCARNPYTCNVWHRCDKDCEGYEPRVKTQGDKIRAMSDEELAGLFAKFTTICEMCIHLNENCTTMADDRCKQGIFEWLKSEVKE